MQKNRPHMNSIYFMEKRKTLSYRWLIEKFDLQNHVKVMACTKFILFISLINFTYCDRRPHIIFILADDMGWNDVGFHGMTNIPTPNIDALAGDGIILNNYYVSPLCTPSRASLMTGLYPSHIGLHHLIIQNGEATGLPLNFTILPQHLAQLGYENHMVGKWHLGFHHEDFTPVRRGFRSHFGFWGSHVDYLDHKSIFLYEHSRIHGLPANFNSPVDGQRQNKSKRDAKPKEVIVSEYLNTNTKSTNRMLYEGVDLRDNLKPARNYNGRYLTDVITEKSVGLIRNHNTTKPLFLYVAHQSPHRANYMRNITSVRKYTKRLDYIKDPNTRNFAGHLAALDRSVGLIMKNLYERNMLKNSVVVFSSDNGADEVSRIRNFGSNWPLRGQKFTIWEGGVRAPAVVWSPLLKNSRRVSNQMMHITDWLPTLFSAAGGDVKELGQIDGKDIWEALSDDQPSPREEILLALDPVWNFSALRYKQYKLVLTSPNILPFDIRGRESRRDVLPIDLCRKRSMTQRVLQHFYINRDGKPSEVIPIINIDCGNTNVGPPCLKQKELCLIDIESDPCEHTDLSELLTEVLSEMLGKLQRYKESSVQHLKKGIEYLANPSLHGGRWASWKEHL